MTKEIPLTQGKVALVDEEDYEELSKYKWHYDSNGYAYRRQNTGYYESKRVSMHRQIMNHAPKGLVVDHINRIKLDNRKENLRVVTQSKNMANSPPRKGTSKYKGVHWSKQFNKWVAKVESEGKFYSLGCYNVEEHAALAYNIKATEIFGDSAYTNDISITEIDKSKEYSTSSEYSGVSLVKRTGKWVSYIKDKDGKRKSLGSYKNEEDAAKAYNEAAVVIYGDDVKLNIIKGVV